MASVDLIEAEPAFGSPPERWWIGRPHHAPLRGLVLWFPRVYEQRILVRPFSDLVMNAACAFAGEKIVDGRPALVLCLRPMFEPAAAVAGDDPHRSAASGRVADDEVHLHFARRDLLHLVPLLTRFVGGWIAPEVTVKCGRGEEVRVAAVWSRDGALLDSRSPAGIYLSFERSDEDLLSGPVFILATHSTNSKEGKEVMDGVELVLPLDGSLGELAGRLDHFARAAGLDPADIPDPADDEPSDHAED